ncbi:MAG: Nif3-like dinuclear metal center hexameric protein [Pseudomonadota bacterium]
MADRTAILSYIDELLECAAFGDYAPNGLQVEGRREIRRLVSGVTASQALIDAAVEHDADALLVHHGFFWKGEDPRVVGMKRRRLGRLLAAGVNLLAYHLPLDAHPELGNNARWAAAMGWRVEGPFALRDGRALGFHGRLPQPMTGAELAAELGMTLGREPVHVAGGPERLERIAWCSGGADGFIAEAAELGVDAYLSGETGEPTVHVARECGLDYFGCGHHATETFGPAALGSHLAETFDLDHTFVDIGSPA